MSHGPFTFHNCVPATRGFKFVNTPERIRNFWFPLLFKFGYEIPAGKCCLLPILKINVNRAKLVLLQTSGLMHHDAGSRAFMLKTLRL